MLASPALMLLSLTTGCATVDVEQVPEGDLFEVGENEDGGNIVAIQGWVDPTTYGDRDVFDARLREWMNVAEAQGWIRPNTVVVLPESIGTWLVLEGEPAAVVDERDGEEALAELIARHLPAFIAARDASPADDENQYALYAMKADEMAANYQHVMSGIAADYAVTLVAGSIVLPEPTIQDGEILAQVGRELRNTSFIFDREGQVVSTPSIECFPSGAEQSYIEPGGTGRLPVVDTNVGRLGVLVGADAWYPDAWQALRDAGAERVVAPIVVSPEGAWSEPWQGYDGWPTPDDVDQQDVRRLTLEEAEGEYGLSGRAHDYAIDGAVSVPLRGEMWDLETDGAITMTLDGRDHVGPNIDGAVIGNLWLPARSGGRR